MGGFMPIFQGQVFSFATMNTAAANDPFIKNSVSDFKYYWIEGFHPFVGKDVVTCYPNPPEGHRHAHLMPIDFNNSKGYTNSKKCWDKWAKDPTKTAMHWNSNDTPTSDHGLFYAVDTNRNAYVFHYQYSNLHSFMNTNNFNQLVIKIEKYLNYYGIELMTTINQSTLFDDKWLVPVSNDKS